MTSKLVDTNQKSHFDLQIQMEHRKDADVALALKTH
jgi:hypothetical protein